MAGFDNEVVYATGLDLSGNTTVSNQLNQDGYIYFGNSSGAPQAGLITSSDNAVTITPGAGTLNITAGSYINNTFLKVSDNLADLSNVVAARSHLGLGSMAPQNSASVNITGGSISGIVDLAVADGGTGSSTAVVALNTLTGAVKAGDVYNLGFSYSAGTFTVTSASGAALSSSNPGYVVLQSKDTPGTLVKYAITADQSFIDDAGASEIIGNLFGFTTGVAVAVGVPFYIYAVSNDAQNGIQFMLSRLPNRRVAPVVGEIGAPDDAVANNQWSFWSFDNINETLFDGNPCLNIGSIIMRMSSSDDWTVDALSASTTGVGTFLEQTFFGQALGQFGADSSQIAIDNGGTAPVFASTVARYFVNLNGFCFYQFNTVNDGGGDGSGAVSAKISVPFIPLLGTNVSEVPSGACFVSFAGGVPRQVIPLFVSDENSLVFRETNAANQTLWSQFTNGGRQISGSIYYRIKDS